MGFRGAICTAKMAEATTSARMAAPTTRFVLRTTRRQASAVARRGARAATAAISVVADPRIEVRVEDVDQEVSEDEDTRGDDHHALHHRVVPRQHAGDGQ